MSGRTADPQAIALFDRAAAAAWDRRGALGPLHRMNALRVGWITRRIDARFKERAAVALLDIGCGAGLASEALAREGFAVLGIDPSAEMIAAARAHAPDLASLRYRVALPEELAAEGGGFAVITALEVIEHVANPGAFIAAAARLLAPGGLLFLSTLNRTPRSMLLAKIGAEFVLRLLPRGTHDWRRFVTPAEMRRMLAASGLRLADIAGMTLDPLRGAWRESRDVRVNYIAMAIR